MKRVPMTPEQQQLAESNIWLARWLVRHHRPDRAHDEDQQAEALHFLCLAASRFETARGQKFSASLTDYIRGAI